MLLKIEIEGCMYCPFYGKHEDLSWCSLPDYWDAWDRSEVIIDMMRSEYNKNYKPEECPLYLKKVEIGLKV